MRDLEIRGAGNLLGGEQHGHLEAVGYDMYIKLLNDAVAEEKGEERPQQEAECLVDVQVDAHIPEDYISSLPQRLEIYRRIADIRTEEDQTDVADELIDRFGDIPVSVEGLLQVALLRNRAAAAGIREIQQKQGSFYLYPQALDPVVISRLVGAFKGRVMVNTLNKPYIAVKADPKKSALLDLKEILGHLLRQDDRKE